MEKLVSKLVAIQSELKAPKGQFNKFGGYKYRSAEDILEAVKPILAKYGCVLIVSDEVKEVGQEYQLTTNDTKKGTTREFKGTRVYVEATATIIDSSGNRLSAKALAREEPEKAGMDASQITGSASSYARKYALNGLFAIDDTKDADATNTHGQSESKAVAYTIEQARKELEQVKTANEARELYRRAEALGNQQLKDEIKAVGKALAEKEATV